MLDPDEGIVSNRQELNDCWDELLVRDFIRDSSREEETYQFTSGALWKCILRELQNNNSSLASRLHRLVARLLCKEKTVNADDNLSARIAWQLLLSRNINEIPEVFRRFRDLAHRRFEHQRFADTIGFCESALRAAAQCRTNHAAQAEVWHIRVILAKALEAQGRWQEALTEFEWLIEVFQTNQMLDEMVDACVMAGSICQKQGQMAQSKAYYDSAYSVIRSHSLSSDTEAYLLRKQATWFSIQGMNRDAIVHYEQALQLEQSLENRAQCEASYAEKLRQEARTEEATYHMQKALEHSQQLSSFTKATIFLQAGILYYTLNDFERSYALLKDANTLSNSQGALELYAQTESWLGTFFTGKNYGQPDINALLHYRQAATLLAQLENVEYLTRFAEEYVLALFISKEYNEILKLCCFLQAHNSLDEKLEQWCTNTSLILQFQLSSN